MDTMTNKKTLTESVLPQFQDVNRYLTGSAVCKNFSTRQEHFLVDKAYKENDFRSLCVLQKKHTGLVVLIARRFQNSDIPMCILVSVGIVGLRKALANYIPNNSTSLSSHCSHMISNEILLHTLKNWNSSKIVKLEETEVNIGWLSQNEIDAIAKRLGIDSETISQMKNRVHSLNCVAAA